MKDFDKDDQNQTKDKTITNPSCRALSPFSYSSPCTSLPTLVPITPLALHLRRRLWEKAVNP